MSEPTPASTDEEERGVVARRVPGEETRAEIAKEGMRFKAPKSAKSRRVIHPEEAAKRVDDALRKAMGES